jgi:hypothetical protein
VDATPIVIDFETGVVGQVIDDQFVGLGADFNGTTIFHGQQTGLPINIFPPNSGDQVTVNLASLGAVIRVDAVGSLWSMAGGYVTATSNVTATMTAYGPSGSVLGSASVFDNCLPDACGSPNPNAFLSVAAPGIAYVEFTGDDEPPGGSFTMDDFTFELPEPAAVVLLGLGLPILLVGRSS